MHGRMSLRTLALCASLIAVDRTASQAPPLHFKLVSVDGERLPLLDASSAACTIGSHYWIDLRIRRWRSVDSTASPNCSSRPPQRIADSGTLRIKGETLSFYRSEAPYGRLLVQRAVLHRDTLRAGAFVFDGPPLVFVRAP